MKSIYLKKIIFIVALLLTIPGAGITQTAAQKAVRSDSQIAERNVRAHMNFLAGDSLQGRGSGTQFEHIAAQYLGSQLQQFSVEPAGGADASGRETYVQTINITRSTFTESPKLSYNANSTPVVLEHGKEMAVFRLNTANISGGLQKINIDEKPKTGAVVFVRARAGDDPQKFFQNLQTLAAGGAAAVLVEETPQWRAQWNNLGSRRLSFTTVSNVPGNPMNVVILSKAASDALAQIADATQVEIKGTLGESQKLQTWNAVGKINGSDARLSSEVVLLSAHLDHVGVRENAPGDDKIFNGADDDASGCVAVLELARVLANGKRPKRTVYFAFYGSEEMGGYGAQYFVNTLPFPKENLVANLQFEMIGRPDPKVAADQLWLTGYDRSNLGAELAKQGAKLVADPHPEENFFQRSDNYTLARQGVIAHTVSSFGLHTDYHRPGDEIEKIDFNHMTRAINSMIEPVRWLANSTFKPVWYEGKKP